MKGRCYKQIEMKLISYLATVHVFHGGFSEEEVDEVSLGHGAHKVRCCN